jgi:Domain of unknown function (DUF4392)
MPDPMPDPIDTIVLEGDRRGVLRLRPQLPGDAYAQAARALLAHHQRVLVLCGFTINGQPETDGPPGAVAIAQALERLGGKAVIVSDAPTTTALLAARRLGSAIPTVYEHPIIHGAAAVEHASALIEELAPSAIVSIERCGPGADGCYRTMRGIDITAATAPLDRLITQAPVGCITLGIGDGGNEVGMGSLAAACLAEGVTSHPCVVEVTHPLLAAVSNWGGWGLVAALSREAGCNLLVGEEETYRLHENLVRAGCIDGITGRGEATVDGHTLDQNLQRLRALHDLLDGLSIPRQPQP